MIENDALPEIRVKELVRERQVYRCLDCGSNQEELKQTLHVHRLVPDSVYSLAGCVAVCQPCHVIRHSRGFSLTELAASNDPRKRRFAELEGEIIDGIRALFCGEVMVKACFSAQEVKHTDLFKDAGHATWGECCRQRWKFEEGEADEIIAAYTKGMPDIDGWPAYLIRNKYRLIKESEERRQNRARSEMEGDW